MGIIERMKAAVSKVKEDRKQDPWYWFTLGYATAFTMVIVDDMVKIMTGIM